MTIREVDGDIFRSSMQTLVNPVNCVGAMGKGLALHFKERWPKYYEAYRIACKHDVLKVDWNFVYDVNEQRKIYSLPTKDHWRDKSTVRRIDRALKVLVEHIRDYGITSLAMPAIGCGEGGLSWEVVRLLIYKRLERVPIEIELYRP
jgi:O-acetyl-ADP-ribose deacetylase (regulator of RNase III)